MTSLGKHLFRGYLRGALVREPMERSATSLTGVLRTIADQRLSRQRSYLLNTPIGQQTRRLSGMSRPIIYMAEPSPPSRAVVLTAKAIGLEIEKKLIDLSNAEHLSAEFRAINPEHTVPTIDDNGFILWDSHAIMGYFVDKYAKNDSLYPKDIKRRAVINQRMHFDSCVLFPRLRFIVFPLVMGITTTVATEKLELLKEGYEHLNNFLEGRKWLAGDSYTLADISCVTTIGGYTCFLPVDDYPNVKTWMQRCAETLPGYEALNNPGNELLHKLIKSKMSSKGKL